MQKFQVPFYCIHFYENKTIEHVNKKSLNMYVYHLGTHEIGTHEIDLYSESVSDFWNFSCSFI